VTVQSHASKEEQAVVEFGFLVLLLASACLAALGLVLFEMARSFTWPTSGRPRGIDPICGAKDRVAIYDTPGLLIPMPDDLRTHEEMVAWMRDELPKLTAKQGHRA
jgi:hypothetical protein